MDEKTPHMHLCFVPLTEDGRLSADVYKRQVWKKRYEKLMEQAQPYLDAVKLAPERVRAFLNAV